MSINKGWKYKIPKFSDVNYARIENVSIDETSLKKLYTWIASPHTEMTSGAWRKTLPLLAMASALHTKSKVLTAVLSAGWNSAHQELRIATQIKTQNKSKRKKKIKAIWGFGGEWKPAASPLNLQLGSGPVHLFLIATGKKKKKKKLDTNFLKNTRNFSSKNTFTSHTIILLVSPTSSFVTFSFETDNWTDIWTFLFFIIVTLSISFYLCLHPFLLSSFSF